MRKQPLVFCLRRSADPPAAAEWRPRPGRPFSRRHCMLPGPWCRSIPGTFWHSLFSKPGLFSKRLWSLRHENPGSVHPGRPRWLHRSVPLPSGRRPCRYRALDGRETCSALHCRPAAPNHPSVLSSGFRNGWPPCVPDSSFRRPTTAPFSVFAVRSRYVPCASVRPGSAGS